MLTKGMKDTVRRFRSLSSQSFCVPTDAVLIRSLTNPWQELVRLKTWHLRQIAPVSCSYFLPGIPQFTAHQGVTLCAGIPEVAFSKVRLVCDGDAYTLGSARSRKGYEPTSAADAKDAIMELEAAIKIRGGDKLVIPGWFCNPHHTQINEVLYHLELPEIGFWFLPCHNEVQYQEMISALTMDLGQLAEITAPFDLSNYVEFLHALLSYFYVQLECGQIQPLYFYDHEHGWFRDKPLDRAPALFETLLATYEYITRLPLFQQLLTCRGEEYVYAQRAEQLLHLGQYLPRAGCWKAVDVVATVFGSSISTLFADVLHNRTCEQRTPETRAVER